MVYANFVLELETLHNNFFTNKVVFHYLKFKRYMEKWWHKWLECTLCHRKSLLVRGNHTNNVAEVGICILMDIVFGRIKAYNIVQMFQFVTDAMELYNKRCLLSIAHNHFDHYVAVKYLGMNASVITANMINKINESKGCLLWPANLTLTFSIFCW